ncbi:hypothetical protein ACLI4U_13165 [Natrialbaceae archaeon A-CW2]
MGWLLMVTTNRDVAIVGGGPTVCSAGESTDQDGVTPIDGHYVVSPADKTDTQAIMFTGRGVQVAYRVIADARLEGRWSDEVAEGVDWMQREATVEGEWTDRKRWIEWFDEQYDVDALLYVIYEETLAEHVQAVEIAGGDE